MLLLQQKITNWKVSEEFNFSDHKTINFTVNFKAVTVSTAYRNVKKTDWTMYREEVQRKREELLSDKGNDNLDSLAIKLEEVLVSAFHKSCKVTKCKKFAMPPWWTPELKASKREVCKLERRLKRFWSEDRLADFRKAKKDHNHLVRDVKGKGWQKLCTEIEKLDAVSRIQRIFKIGKKQEIGTVRKEDGEYTTNTEDTLKVLLDKHFPDKEIADEGEPRIYQGNLSNDEINDIINIEAVRTAIKGFKPLKAPGLDGIYPILIQKAMDIIENDILFIYRMSLKEGKSPIRWLETKVAFIPKPGKQDYTDPGSLRPICLSPFFSKGLERVLFWHINDKHLRNDPCKNSFAYTESVSTDDAIHSLVIRIERALERGEVAIVLFMDMSAAFSTANVDGLINNLETTGVNSNILQWTDHMLRNRMITASMNGTQVQKRSSRGCPQGGILSGPILWNGVMKDLIRRFREIHGTYRAVFADDIFNIGTGLCEFTVAKNIQRDVKVMERWASDHGLRFNVSKTKLMFFTNRRIYTKPDIFLYGEKIEYVSEMRYLGVLIDDKLSWLPHIKKTAQKATFTMMQCRKMVGKSWGLKPKINRWLYATLVRPVLAYGCLSWIKSTEVQSHMDQFKRVQRRACLATLNALNSTPTDGMEVMLNLEPIHIFIQAQAINTYRRLLSNGNWIPVEGEGRFIKKSEKMHSNIIKRLAMEIPSIYQPRDKLTNTEYLRTNFSTIISTREEANRIKIRPMPHQEGTVHCFTDGSKNDQSSGSGYLIMGTGIRAQGYKNLGKTTSVYQAEIQAIIDAATKIIEHGITNLNVHFFVDNQAAIQSLGNFLVKNDLVARCKRLLNVISMTNEVTINWIPGHSDQMGNEIADRLAKLGTKHNVITNVPVPDAAVKQDIKKWMKQKHQREWSNPERSDFCRQTKMILPEINSKFWKQLKRYPRHMMNRITQLYTGQSLLQKDLHKIGLADSPTCEQCLEEEESVEHYLCECPAFATPRYNNLGGQAIKKEELQHLKLRKILAFVKDSKRFEE